LILLFSLSLQRFIPLNTKHVNIIFARYVITVIYTRLYMLFYFLLRRFRVTVVSAKRKIREPGSVIFLIQSRITRLATGFTGRTKPLWITRVITGNTGYRLKYRVSYIFCLTAKQATRILALAVR